ncbi:MAG TPA: PepSY-associated TM helix domain-containing protein [Chitinophagaceae bacterium]
MMKSSTTKNNWQKIRKLFNDIHLWLGLSSGLIVIAICFSGTVYVYNTELTERAAPHLYKVKPLEGQQRIPVDSLLEKIRTNTGGTITSLAVPADLERTYQFNVKTQADSTNRGGTTYMVNPYTGDIVGNSKEKNGTKEFMSTMFSLHRWLLFDRIKSPIIKGKTNRELGSIITGTATIIFTLGCITGLIIWFPQKVRNWKQGLKIKWNAGWKRINHDLHNALAIYALFFLLLMGLTGPQFSFEWYRNGLQKTLGTFKPKNAPKEKTPKSKISTGTMSLSLSVSDYIKETDRVLTYKGNYSITMPVDSTVAVTISKTKTGFFAPAAGDRITLDQYSGNTLKVDIFKNKPFNERLAGSIKAIHVGNVYGGFSKILYFLACLIATSLPITGTMIWLNKLKKRRRSSQPAKPEMAMA